MENDIGLGLLIAAILGISIAVMIQAISFLSDVPKHLKRIADALEKKGAKDGSSCL